MTGNLYQDWPVYILLGAVAFFFIYVIIKSNLPEKKEKIERVQARFQPRRKSLIGMLFNLAKVFKARLKK